MNKKTLAMTILAALCPLLAAPTCDSVDPTNSKITMHVSEKVGVIERLRMVRGGQPSFCGGSIELHAMGAGPGRPFAEVLLSSHTSGVEITDLLRRHSCADGCGRWAATFTSPPMDTIAISLLPGWAFPTAAASAVPLQDPTEALRRGDAVWTELGVAIAGRVAPYSWTEAMVAGILYCTRDGRRLSADDCARRVPYVKWWLHECPDRRL